MSWTEQVRLAAERCKEEEESKGDVSIKPASIQADKPEDADTENTPLLPAHGSVQKAEILSEDLSAVAVVVPTRTLVYRVLALVFCVVVLIVSIILK